MKTSESRFSGCMYFVSSAYARKIEKMAVQVWKKVDLSPSHAYLLMMVLDDPGIQPMTLSGELHLTPSTITRLIEKLEDKKLVTRITDGKLTNVYPTPKAKDLRPKLNACQEEFMQVTIDSLGKEESDRLIKGLIKVADKIG